MKANLHTHSFFSDGSLPPEQIAQLAAEAAVEIIALSDHNTFAGYERLADACAKLSIHAVKAVEIDCVQPEIGFRSELLAYFPNGAAEQIEPILARRIAARKQRVIKALERSKTQFSIDNDLFNYDYFHQWVVQDTGYDLTCSGGVAQLYLSNKQLHSFLTDRWDIKLPDYPTTQEFQLWKDIWRVDIATLAASSSCDDLYSTIQAVRNAGGFPVLPHFAMSCKLDPDHMSRNSDTYLEHLRTMKSHGLWAMEIHPYRYKATAAAMNAKVREWAEVLGLRLTAGSDFHGFDATHHIFDSMSFDFDGIWR